MSKEKRRVSVRMTGGRPRSSTSWARASVPGSATASACGALVDAVGDAEVDRRVEVGAGQGGGADLVDRGEW